MHSLRYIIGTAIVLMGGLGVAVTLNSKGAPEDRTYVGQESCAAADCHEGPYGSGSSYAGFDEFKKTMHQRIHLRPNPETVVIDHLFEKDTVIKGLDLGVRAEGKDTLLIRLYKENGDYMIGMKYSGGGDSVEPMKVEYTYGGNGWIQRFLVKVGDSYYVPPFQYVLPGYRERHGEKPDLHYTMEFNEDFVFLDQSKWRTVDPATEEAEFHEWNSNTFRKFSWDKNCTACHVNGFDFRIEVDGEDSTWISEWAGKDTGDSAMMDQNILIGCESCHGPGSEHVENPTADNIIAPRKWEGFAGTDLKLDLCGQCHTRFKSPDGEHGYAYDPVAGEPYVPGQLLDDFIRDRNRDAQYWGDLRTSIRHHQTNNDYKRSKPYQEHVFVDGCWSCHLVHRQVDTLPYMLDRNWYSMEQGEGCLTFGCHDSYNETAEYDGRTVNKHTFHSVESSTCVNCHFTRTATITFSGTYEFSDHGFRVIPPQATIDWKDGVNFNGLPNTCASSCHRNGRGDRNPDSEQPVAPDFGLNDKIIAKWNESTDLWLADSLQRYYTEWWGKPMSVNRETGIATTTTIATVQPNPTSGSATIRFEVDKRRKVTLAIYDINGNMIATLESDTFEPGVYTTQWDGANLVGTAVPSGTYYVRLQSGDVVTSHRIILTR